jgi:hypothetical protein
MIWLQKDELSGLNSGRGIPKTIFPAVAKAAA